ncbi:MAG: imidazolonepropionase [Longimicrobiales bacterium]
MTEPIDSLFYHCGELVTLTDGPPTGPRRGSEMSKLGSIPDGAVAVHDQRIVETGPSDQLMRRYRARRELDLSGFLVMPGFVDCHTHPVFTRTREEEFHLRCAGADYMEIAARGGGILSSVKAVREASLEELTAATRGHLEAFLVHGTTTVEAKSGYGLTTADEDKSLKALNEAARSVPLTVSRTFLGAHEFPPEYREDRDAYVELVVREMLPQVVDLCESCDVFAEPGVFDRSQARRVLTAASGLGLRLRVHADEIQPMAGTELAVELGADSVDHLARISLDGQDQLAASRTTAVLLPGTTFFLGKSHYAPARSMIDKGCAVALATDFNPGSCHTQSMAAIITLGCLQLHMTPAECIHAVTINAAASLHLDDQVGTLHPGKRADLVALDLPSHRSLGYAFGGNPVGLTVVGGELAVINSVDRDQDQLHVVPGGLPHDRKERE